MNLSQLGKFRTYVFVSTYYSWTYVELLTSVFS